MKKPKLNKKLKKPDKKPAIKNRFLQKNLLSLIVIAVLAIGTGTAYGTLSSKDADRGNDPVNGVNKDRYQVLISGEGYKLSKKQEKDYKLQKKQNEANVNRAAQDDPKVIRSSSGSRIFRSGSSYRYSSSTYRSSKNPRLSTNISDQISSLPDKVKAGEVLKFRVSAYAYPYGSKNAISKDNIKVTVQGGKEARVYKEKSGYVYYEVELGEGDNVITISATDKKTKKTSKLGPYKIKKVGANSGSGGSNTNPSNTDTPSADDITKAAADLSEYGLEPIEFSGAALSSIIEKAKDDQKIEVIEFENLDAFTMGDYENGDIINKYKAEKGITGDLSDEQKENYKAWFNEKEKSVRDNKKLGKGYPFSETCWKYTVDGDTVNLELSLLGD